MVDLNEIRAVLVAAGVDPDAPATSEGGQPAAVDDQPTDFRTASREDYLAELNRLGIKAPRGY